MLCSQIQRQRKQTLHHLLLLSVLCVVWVVPLIAGAAESETGKVTIRVGHELTLNTGLDDLGEISVGARSVVDARQGQGSEIIVVGLQPGQSAITGVSSANKKKTYIISVISVGLEEVEAMISTIPGVRARTVGSKIALEGKVTTEADQKRIETIAAAYPEIVNLVSLQGMSKALRDIIQRDINERMNLVTVTAEVTDKNIILRGSVFHESDVEAVEKLVKSYGREVVNMIVVRAVHVEIDAVILKWDKGDSSALGSNILQRITGKMDAGYGYSRSRTSTSGDSSSDSSGEPTGETDSSSSASTGEGDSDSPTRNCSFNASVTNEFSINAWEGLADGEVVACPHLSTLSGQEASFTAGGERGFETAGADGAGAVEYKEFGTRLTVLPIVHADGSCQVKVAVEMSEPRGLEGLEVINLDKTVSEAHVLLNLGETIVLSGLEQVGVSNSISRFPVLGRIPVLNLLFAHKAKSFSRKEIAIFVTLQSPTVEKLFAEAYSRKAPGRVDDAADVLGQESTLRHGIIPSAFVKFDKQTEKTVLDSARSPGEK